MEQQISACDITLTPFDNKRLLSLCGRVDEHLRQIETRLSVDIIVRGNIIHISGPQEAIDLASKVINNLYQSTGSGVELSPDDVHLFIQQVMTNMDTQIDIVKEGSATPNADITCIKTPQLLVSPRTKNQKEYINSIMKNDVNFGIGPAGTGKTFLAVACAVQALEQKRIRRVILVRPVVEAGEKLGFLPGDLAQKIDPYLRPLYDAFHDMYGFERVAKLIEQQIIEIAPLAYMRGRTLNDAFIILDEAQNATKDQMKMFLTRIGFNSTAVITGDITQIDLPSSKQSGLKHASDILQNVKHISFSYFGSKDVVRHPVVQHIIEAYEKNLAENKGGDN